MTMFRTHKDICGMLMDSETVIVFLKALSGVSVTIPYD